MSTDTNTTESRTAQEQFTIDEFLGLSVEEITPHYDSNTFTEYFYRMLVNASGTITEDIYSKVEEHFCEFTPWIANKYKECMKTYDVRGGWVTVSDEDLSGEPEISISLSDIEVYTLKVLVSEDCFTNKASLRNIKNMDTSEEVSEDKLGHYIQAMVRTVMYRIGLVDSVAYNVSEGTGENMNESETLMRDLATYMKTCEVEPWTKFSDHTTSQVVKQVLVEKYGGCLPLVEKYIDFEYDKENMSVKFNCSIALTGLLFKSRNKNPYTLIWTIEQ